MARRRKWQNGCFLELFILPFKIIFFPLKIFEYIFVMLWNGLAFLAKSSIKHKKHNHIPSRLKVDMAMIDVMEGHDFEYLFADILKKLGYRDVIVTPGSGDRGADVIAYMFDGGMIKTTFQCKRYSHPVGNAAVQEVYAAKGIYNADEAVVVTTNYFTRQAVEDAEKLGVKLWDRCEFIKMLDLYKQV